jgi:hypothetical protein
LPIRPEDRAYIATGGMIIAFGALLDFFTGAFLTEGARLAAAALRTGFFADFFGAVFFATLDFAATDFLPPFFGAGFFVFLDLVVRISVS